MKKILKRIFSNLKSLPDIGNKTAERLTYSILNAEKSKLKKLANDIEILSENLKKCSVCGVLSLDDPCEVCNDPERENKLLIVESSKEYYKIEMMRLYNGKYHVLGGLISPFKNIDIKSLNINKLIERIKNEHIEEVIIGLSPIPESAVTKEYIINQLKSLNIKITEFATGISTGQYIENIDEITLKNAFLGRKDAQE